MKLKGKRLPFFAIVDSGVHGRLRDEYKRTCFYHFAEKNDPAAGTNLYKTDFWIRLNNFTDTAKIYTEPSAQIVKTAKQIYDLTDPPVYYDSREQTKRRLIRKLLK